jgi:hypothetical protein
MRSVSVVHAVHVQSAESVVHVQTTTMSNQNS